MTDTPEKKEEEAPIEPAAEIKPPPSGVTVNFSRKPILKPTLNLVPPPGGWNPGKHQQPKKPVGKTKYS